MKKFIKNIQRAANRFTVVDYALFKIYMVSVGVLAGSYFAQFWIGHINIVWGVAIVTGLFIIFKLIRNYLKLK